MAVFANPNGTTTSAGPTLTVGAPFASPPPPVLGDSSGGGSIAYGGGSTPASPGFTGTPSLPAGGAYPALPPTGVPPPPAAPQPGQMYGGAVPNAPALQAPAPTTPGPTIPNVGPAQASPQGLAWTQWQAQLAQQYPTQSAQYNQQIMDPNSPWAGTGTYPQFSDWLAQQGITVGAPPTGASNPYPIYTPPAPSPGTPGTTPSPMSQGSPPWAQSWNSGSTLPSFVNQPNAPLPSAQQWQNYTPTEQQAILGAAQSMGIPPQDFLQMMSAANPEWGAPQQANYVAL